MLGRVIAGKYHVVRVVRAGGMGIVCEAIHRGTGRRVAVKLVMSDTRPPTPELIARFQREARAAGSVDTEHIVQVLDAGSDEATGLPFLVMELLTGEDLQQLLRRLRVL